MAEYKKMKKMYGLIVERLNIKKLELFDREQQFDVMWHNEKNSGCFERNAINHLLVTQQLKSEIAELEHCEALMRVQIGGNE